MKTILALIVLALLLPLAANAQCADCQKHMAVGNILASAESPNATKYIFSSPKKTYWISSDRYISYQWQSKPKIGPNVLLVTVYAKGKVVDNQLAVTANTYMPSMRGAHDTGHQPLQINKKKVYAIPVNFVMGGDWEVELKFSQDGKPVYTGYIDLKI